MYKNTCYDRLSNGDSNASQMQPGELFKLAIKVTSNELSKASNKYFSENGTSVFGGSTNKLFLAALVNCRKLLSMALDSLDASLSLWKSVLGAMEDLNTSAGTYKETCIDGLEEAKQGIRARISEYLKNSSEMTSNALAIFTWILKVERSLKLRRLMGADDKVSEWVRPEDRKQLQSPEYWKRKADAVVGKDRSAKYKTISDALKAVPDESNKRFIIYVKKGVCGLEWRYS